RRSLAEKYKKQGMTPAKASAAVELRLRPAMDPDEARRKLAEGSGQRDEVLVSLVVAVDDDAPDAVIACPPLRILELAIIRERQAKLRHQLKTVRDQSRRLVVTQQIERLAARTGMALGQARQIVERQYAGILLLALAVPAGDRLLGTRGATP